MSPRKIIRREHKHRRGWGRKRWMALTGARMIRRKVILLVVRQSSFPLNSVPLPFIPRRDPSRHETPGLPHYSCRRSRRSPLCGLTTDTSLENARTDPSRGARHSNNDSCSLTAADTLPASPLPPFRRLTLSFFDADPL